MSLLLCDELSAACSTHSLSAATVCTAECASRRAGAVWSSACVRQPRPCSAAHMLATRAREREEASARGSGGWLRDGLGPTIAHSTVTSLPTAVSECIQTALRRSARCNIDISLGPSNPSSQHQPTRSTTGLRSGVLIRRSRTCSIKTVPALELRLWIPRRPRGCSPRWQLRPCTTTHCHVDAWSSADTLPCTTLSPSLTQPDDCAHVAAQSATLPVPYMQLYKRAVRHAPTDRSRPPHHCALDGLNQTPAAAAAHFSRHLVRCNTRVESLAFQHHISSALSPSTLSL